MKNFKIEIYIPEEDKTKLIKKEREVFLKNT